METTQVVGVASVYPLFYAIVIFIHRNLNTCFNQLFISNNRLNFNIHYPQPKQPLVKAIVSRLRNPYHRVSREPLRQRLHDFRPQKKPPHMAGGLFIFATKYKKIETPVKPQCMGSSVETRNTRSYEWWRTAPTPYEAIAIYSGNSAHLLMDSRNTKLSLLRTPSTVESSSSRNRLSSLRESINTSITRS